MARLHMKQGTLLMNWIEKNEAVTRNVAAERWMDQAAAAVGFAVTAAQCRDRQRSLGLMKTRPVKPKAAPSDTNEDMRFLARMVERVAHLVPMLPSDMARLKVLAHGQPTQATLPMFLPVPPAAPPKMWPQADA